MNFSQSLAAPEQSHQLAVALAKAIPPEMIAKALAEGMVATTVSRSGAVEIDHRARLEATKLALAYQQGTPLQRAAVVTKKVESDADEDLAVRLKRSPALRRSLKKIISDAEGEEG